MSEFDKYLKEKNIKMTTDDYNFCISCIQDDVRVIAMRPRQMNKSFLNGLIIDFKFWCKEQENTELKKKLEISEKALELACELLQDINYKTYNTEYDFKQDFIKQAKEKLKGE